LIIFLALLWTVGCPIRLFTLLGAVILGAAGLLIWAEPYRLARVTSFLDPMADPLGRGHQALQSLYALGTGGLTGVGLGNSRSKWGALPNGHSDFIFAIIGEELGLIGAITVLLLFAALIYAGLRIAHRSSDPFVKLVAAVIVIWQVSQAMINIGYVINLLPVTGITLPMISSGGTSLVITMFMMGILASCARHEPAAVAYLHRRSIKLPRMLRLHVPPSAICSDPRRTSPLRKAPSGRPSSPARTVKPKPAAARTTARAVKLPAAKRAAPRPRAATRRPSTAPPRRRAG
ncbi:MAG: FtsW/RodA/SpoVE family cell cycle protein, partial [Antricoccus sp.]